MKINESKNEQVRSGPQRRSSYVGNSVHGASLRWWLRPIVVMAITMALSNAPMQQAYGEGPPSPGEIAQDIHNITVFLKKQSEDTHKDTCALFDPTKTNPDYLKIILDALGQLPGQLGSLFEQPGQDILNTLTTCGNGSLDLINGVTGYINGIIGKITSSVGPSILSTGMRYPDYIVANQAGTRLYTANFDSTVATIDVAASALIGTIQFPSDLDGGDTEYTLKGIAINPMGTRLYVLNTIYKTTSPTYTLLGNTLEVIDTETNSVIASVPLGLESLPNDIVVDASGSRIYVSTTDIKIHDTGQVEYLNTGKVDVIDAATNSVVKTIAFSRRPPGPLAANPDGHKIYAGVSHYTDVMDVPARVAVIDTSQNRVTQTIDLEGGSPRRLVINPTGTRLYVTYVTYATDDNFVEVIDTASNQVITRIDIPVDLDFTADLQVTRDGAFLFVSVDVSTDDPDLIYIIDTETNAIVATGVLPAGIDPDRIASFIAVLNGQVPLSNFSSASFILQVPVIQVPGAGEYNASFVLSDAQNLELTLTDVSGTSFQTGSPAVFSPDTGVLTLPVLAIDGKEFFQVDLTLVPGPGSLRFRVTQVELLP
jgi:YVTN family beta-propeller protein